MTYANQDIRTKAKKSGVPFWRIAIELEISEPTFTRKMRMELPMEEKQKIFAIIERLKEGK